MKSILLPILLALAVPCFGQSDYIKSDLINAPDSVPAGDDFYFEVPRDIAFSITPQPRLIKTREDEKVSVYWVQPAIAPGYTINIDYAIQHPTEKELESAPWDDREKFKAWLKVNSRDEFYQDRHTVRVGPQPPGPGPGPTPTPDPPDPGPTPSPAPIPEPGFRVLIVFEKGPKENLPILQHAVIYGKDVRDYLDKTCVKESTGLAAYRIVDQNQDLSTDLPVWQNALGRKRTAIPWVVISNGVTGTEQALPASPSAFIELCKKYEVK